jgi:hypothetical protein
MSLFGSRAPTIRGNYSGFSGTNVVTGRNGKILEMATKDKAKTRKSHEYFGFLYPKWREGMFTRRNGRVPQLGFNSSGIKSAGFVPANEGNNTTILRERVAEQNFIQRLSKQINDAIINKNPKPIDLKEYADKLKSVNTEEEAITIYNELIGLFIMHIIYLDLIIKNIESGGSYWERKKVITPEFLRKSFNKEKIYSMMSLGGRILAGMMFSPQVLLVSPGLVGTIPIIAVVSLVGSYLLQGTIEKRLAKGEALRLSLFDVIAEIRKIMFLPENGIPIINVKDKLKYWGLTTSQVEYLFTETPDSALQIFNEKKRQYLAATEELIEIKDKYNSYNDIYIQEKLRELRSDPRYKRPYFNNTNALTQGIQDAKLSNDDYITNKFVVDYNEAQEKLKDILSSEYRMSNKSISYQLDANAAFIILFLCLPVPSNLAPSDLAPNEPLTKLKGPRQLEAEAAAATAAAGAAAAANAAAANAAAAAAAATAAAGAAATAAAAETSTRLETAAAANTVRATVNPTQFLTLAPQTALATAAPQQATALANAVGAPILEDDHNKQTLIEIENSLSYIRRTLKQRGIRSLKGYIRDTLKIRSKIPLLYKLSESLVNPKKS